MIAVITATFEEIENFSRELTAKKRVEYETLHAIEGKFLGGDIVLIISGVGIRKARNAASLALTRYKPQIILCAGFSGALSYDLRVSDIVVGTDVMSLQKNESIKLYSDFPYLPFNYSKGVILTESRFISSRGEKELLFRESKALSVDMETWGVAEILKDRDINLISVRVISDDLEYSLPKMEKLFNKNSRLNVFKSLLYFLKYPGYIIPFFKFRYVNIRKASIRLTHFLLVLIPVLSELDN